MATGTAILTPPGRSAPATQNNTLFRIYVAYRTLLSVVLLIMLISPKSRELVGTLNPVLYLAVALCYLASNIVLMSLRQARLYNNNTALFAVFFVDIVVIVLLSGSSRGMSSGLPILLVISSAASAVLVHNRTLATLIAALAVIAALSVTVRLISIGEATIASLMPTGLLGLLIFGVSLLVQAIANRLGRAEELARNHASDLYNLQRLNEQIVQHLQAGILLISADNSVRIMNSAASRLLIPERPGNLEQGRRLRDYSAELAQQFEHWHSTGVHRATPFTVRSGEPPIIANFRSLQSRGGDQSLVFLEDYSPVTQYAQSLKLNSLGRLTASIAHEIRNPLGAVSHAAQLLQESDTLAPADQRMADIILHHGKRMNAIIESVMQISRREPPKPECFPLAEWLEQTVQDYLDSLQGGAEIVIDCEYRELVVEFDPENLNRVVTNLLDNGLRHGKLATGREEARITVSLDPTAHRCFLDIIDLGEGVPEIDRPKLFEPFFTTVKEGSGMGLFLCQELCEINNASLSYRPSDRGESCFRITLDNRA